MTQNFQVGDIVELIRASSGFCNFYKGERAEIIQILQYGKFVIRDLNKCRYSHVFDIDIKPVDIS